MIGRFTGFVRRRGVLGALSSVVARLYDPLYSRLYGALLGVEMGEGARIMPGAKVRRGPGGRVVLGPRTVIQADARILAYGGLVQLGADCTLNPFSILYGHAASPGGVEGGGLVIGDRVLIAAATIIIPANHVIDDAPSIRHSGITAKGIVVEDDVWLAAGVRVLDGVHIGRGAVVAAGAVVPEGTLAPFTIYGGVPARPIGKRPIENRAI